MRAKFRLIFLLFLYLLVLRKEGMEIISGYTDTPFYFKFYTWLVPRHFYSDRICFPIKVHSSLRILAYVFTAAYVTNCNGIYYLENRPLQCFCGNWKMFWKEQVYSGSEISKYMLRILHSHYEFLWCVFLLARHS